MPPCQICGDNTGLAYTCNECGGKYCSEHRLPEAHHCDALAINFTKPLESDAPATRGLSEHAARHERVRDNHVEKTDSREDETDRAASKNRKRDREKPPEEDRYQCPGCQEHFYLRRACSGCGTRYCTDCRPSEAHDCSQTFATDSTSTGEGRRSGRRYGNQGTNNLESDSRRTSPVTAFLSYILTPFVLLWWWKKPLLLVGLLVVGASIAPGVPPDSFLPDEEQATVDETVQSFSSGATAAPNSSESTENRGVNETVIEQEIHARVNEVRAEFEREQLRSSKPLATAARRHSRAMGERGKLYHGDIRSRYGDQCKAVGENVAYTYASANIRTSSGVTVNHNGNETKIAHGLVRQWMNSPGHRENILRIGWYAEGIGVNTTYTDGKLRVYATQGFCGN